MPNPILILLLPLIEIGLFVWTIRWFGWEPILLVTLATSFLGWMILNARRNRLTPEGISRTLGAESRTVDDILGSALIPLAGFLLFIPGFLTDLAGLALLIPFIRRVISKKIQKRFYSFYNTKTWGFSIDDFPNRPSEATEPRSEDSDIIDVEYTVNNQKLPR